jgi:hypothetical protein
MRSILSVLLSRPATLTEQHMQFFDGATTRDGIIVLAWVAMTVWLKLCAAAARIAGTLRPSPRARMAPRRSNPVAQLQVMAERGVWRCETLAALQSDAHAAIAEAEDAHSRVLAQIAAATAAAAQPAQGSRPCARETAPIAA